MDASRGQQPPEEQRSVKVLMPDSLHQAVKQKARREDRSMAQAIRHALRLWTTGVTGD